MTPRLPVPALAALAMLVSGGPVWSQPPVPADHSAHHGTGAAASGSPAPAVAAAELASGEVRRVDKAAGKLTLRHGEIKALDMPPMTMVFQVIDAAFLDRVKVGDKVRFRADQQGGAYRVIELQLAP